MEGMHGIQQQVQYRWTSSHLVPYNYMIDYVDIHKKKLTLSCLIVITVFLRIMVGNRQGDQRHWQPF